MKTKISTESPTLDATADGIPNLYLKQGSRYRQATGKEIMSVAVLLLAHNGMGNTAFNLQVALGMSSGQLPL